MNGMGMAWYGPEGGCLLRVDIWNVIFRCSGVEY